MGDYILSVTAAAMVLGIVSAVLDSKSTAGALVKLIGGLYLTFVIIQPLARFDFDRLFSFAQSFSVQGQTASTQGQELARDTMAGIIKSQTEAYILDKAGLYRAELNADVTLSSGEIPVPASVTIRGSASPYARGQLQKLIEEDLDISKEDQLWIGMP